MKIIRLQAENVKRLKVVEISPSPDGGLVIIRGNNGQGKSSVLDSIAYALGGKGTHPPKVIREGEREAHVLLELDDIIVERRWTANDRSYLEVRGKDGAPHKSPQALLDSLVGRLSFDPLAFTRLDAKAQAEALRRAVGLDFSRIDGERAKLYGDRTLLNRDLERARARLQSLPQASAPHAPVDVAELLKRQEELQEVEHHAQELGHQAELAAQKAHAAGAFVTELEGRLAKLRDEVKRLEKGLELARTQYSAAEKWEREAVGVAKNAPSAGEDLHSIREQLEQAEGTNAAARKSQERQRLAAEVAELIRESDVFTARITAIDQEKAEVLAAAPFPIKGLAFADSGVTLQGVPLEQASQAEQLRVSVAMGLALNPEIRVLLVRDGSLLDDQSTALLGELADRAGAQVWLEVVGTGGVGVVIEDGEVLGAEKPQQGTTEAPSRPAPRPRRKSTAETNAEREAAAASRMSIALGLCEECGDDNHPGRKCK